MVCQQTVLGWLTKTFRESIHSVQLAAHSRPNKLALSGPSYIHLVDGLLYLWAPIIFDLSKQTNTCVKGIELSEKYFDVAHLLRPQFH